MFQVKFWFKNLETYTAFIHNGFDDQERNLMFVKTVFQVSKNKISCLQYEASFLSSS